MSLLDFMKLEGKFGVEIMTEEAILSLRAEDLPFYLSTLFASEYRFLAQS